MQRALHTSCLNKFTLSWETRVPRKTTFVTFFCSWNFLWKSLKKKKEREKRGKKGFHFDSRRLPGRRERKCENRGKASQFCVFVMLDMCSVTSLVKSFSIWPSLRLKFGGARILCAACLGKENVESLCLLRPVAYSSVAFVRAEVWHRTCSSESCFSTGLVSAGAFSSSPHLVPAAHWCTVCLFSVCSRSSVCVVAYCSCIGVLKKKISVLGPDLLPQPVGEEVEAVRRRLPNIGKEAQWRREIAPVEAWAGNPNLLVGLLIWWFMHF